MQRHADLTSSPRHRWLTAGIVITLGLLGADGGGAAAQTPAASLDSQWIAICAAVTPGSDLAGRCDEILNAGPGSGDRRSEAALGNNLDIFAAQGRIGRQDGEPSGQIEVGRWSLFLTANRLGTERSDSGFENGFQTDEDSVLFGVDYLFGRSLIGGLTLRATDADTRFDRAAGSLQMDTTAATAYINWLPGDRQAVDAFVGTSRFDMDTRRRIDYTLVLDAGLPTESTATIRDTAVGSTDGSQITAGVAWSYDALQRATVFGPRLSLRHLQHDVDRYAEAASSGLGLSLPDQEITSLRGRVGFDLGKSFSRGWGVLTPSLSACAVREFDDDARSLDTRFVQAADAEIAVNTVEPDEDFFEVRASLAATFGRGVVAFVDYETRLEHDFLDAETLSAGLRFELGAR